MRESAREASAGRRAGTIHRESGLTRTSPEGWCKNRAMERYERGDQFVEFEQVLSMLRIRTGRIGTPGKEDRRFHPTSDASLQAEMELRTRLLREGYRRVTGAGGELLLGATPPGPAAPRALLLDARGDVVLREAAPEPPPRPQDLASEVLGEALGDAVRAGDLTGLEWEGRTLRAVSVGYDGSGLVDPLEFDNLAALLQSNGRRGLRRLEVFVLTEASEFAHVLQPFQDHGVPSSLRHLVLCAFDNIEGFLATRADVTALLPALRDLERLELQAGHVSFDRVDLPELRDFQLRTAGLGRDTLRALSAARWPALDRLTLWFGSPRHGGDCRVEDLASLLDGEHFPRLRHLRLMNATFTDELCEALVSSRLLPRLRSVDLSLGLMTDEGARTLARHAAALGHLQKLSLVNNALTHEGEALLEATSLPVELSGPGHQGGNDSVEHFVPLSQGDGYVYLFQTGDAP